MPKTSTLASLKQKIEAQKSKQFEQIEQIERAKLSELIKNLNEQLQEDLDTTSDAIVQSIERLKRAIIKHEKAAFSEIRDSISESSEIIEELQEQIKKLRKSTLKRSIYSMIAPFFLLLGLGLGAWGIGAYAAHQIEQIAEMKKKREEIAQTINTVREYQPILKVWDNGIELKKGFRAQVGTTKEGRDFIVIKEK